MADRPRTPAPAPAPAPAGTEGRATWGVGRIVLGYAVGAGLWILLSDRMVGVLFRTPAALMLASSLKGLVFVTITSILLYATLARYVRGLKAKEALTSREEWEKIRALQLLGVLSEASPDAIYVKDDQGRYLLFNQAAGRLVGKDPQEVLGQDDRRLFPAAEVEVMIGQDQRALAAETAITLEEVLTTTAGTTTFLTTKGPIRDAEGRVVALYGIARDISERKRMEEALRDSETKFSNIFHLSPDAVDLTRLDTGVFVDLNGSYVNLYGYQREELIGRSSLPGDLGIWLHKRDRDQHVANLMAHGIVLGLEAPMRRKDGSTFIALISSSLVEIKGERYNLSLARDITRQKQVEEALRESNQRLELAIASSRLGIWDRDLVEETELWNDRIFELYGLEPQSAIPSYDFWHEHILHPDDRLAAGAAIREAIAGTRPYDLQFRVVHQDGSVHHIKSNGQVIRDASGRAVRITGINRDRTREVEAEAEHLRLQQELQHAEKLESIGSLAGGVAHDMNNVLAAIMGMASTLHQACPEGDPRARSLDTIIRACTRGRDVVRSLLYFARQDLDAVGPVDLNAIAREMVQLLSYTTLRRVEISTEFQEPLGLIQGDGGALSHALINLCVNAVDAMPEGGALALRTRRRPGGEVEFSIKDTGDGMTPEVARRAIEPFFTTKPMGKGTGLGLAMVYGTVKAHKGALEIRSEPGQGTEVILSFPPLPDSAAGAAAPVAEPSPSPARRILLVDDDELIRMSVGPMLTALGHEVELAQSGQEALERFQSGLRVDLVILDMNMPGLNGAQTLARLLALQPGQPVLMATGYSDDSIAPLLAGRPNVHSLRKPFTLKELRTKLSSI